MKQIKITPNKLSKSVIIDDDMFEFINRYKWHYNGHYAMRGTRDSDGKSKTVYMHREVIVANKGEIVDHINRNPLDNRKSNLRICNTYQNSMNRSNRSNNTSGYKGVSWFKRDSNWVSHIRLYGKSMNIGYFSSKISAAKAYDKKAKELFGEFANLNFK